MNYIYSFLVLSAPLATAVGQAIPTVYIEQDYLQPTDYKVAYIQQGDTLVQNSKRIKVPIGAPIIYRLRNFNADAMMVETSMGRADTVSQNAGKNAVSTFLRTFLLPVMGIDLKKIVAATTGRGETSSMVVRPETVMAALAGSGALRVSADLFKVLPALSPDELGLLLENRMVVMQTLDQGVSKMKALHYHRNRATPTAIREQARQLLATLDPDLPELVDKSQTYPLLAAKQITVTAAENGLIWRGTLQRLLDQASRDTLAASRGDDNSVRRWVGQRNTQLYKQLMTDTTEARVRQQLQTLYSEYQAIYANNYETSVRVLPTGTTTELYVSVYPMISASGTVLHPSARKVPVERMVYPVQIGRDIDIIASAGFGLMGFNKAIETYSLTNGVVKATRGDELIPALNGMITLTSNGIKSVKPGVSLGVLVPLSGDNRGFALHLGPALVLGRTNFMLVNMGVMLGRITRLGEGLNVGDTYPSGNTLPTVKRYEFGYTIGLSLNLAALKL
ncbi:hypothetical protein [Spirosoma areae]